MIKTHASLYRVISASPLTPKPRDAHCPEDTVVEMKQRRSVHGDSYAVNVNYLQEAGCTCQTNEPWGNRYGPPGL